MARESIKNHPWTVKDDVSQIANQFGSFCGRIAELSAANPPAGVNAANGYFRTAVLTDGTLSSLVPPRTSPKDDEAVALYQLTSSLEQGLRGAFGPENYESRWTHSAALLITFVREFGGKAAAIAESVVGVVVADPAQKVALAAATVKQVQDLSKEIDAKGIKFEGTNANGYIQKNVDNTASAIKSQIASLKSGGKLASNEAKNYADAIDGICQKILDIPDFENDPWLVGAWQLQFQTVMSASAAALKTL